MSQNHNAVYATDEYGRPFIIVKEQEKKERLSGIEAQKVFKYFCTSHIFWQQKQSHQFLKLHWALRDWIKL
jgi:hypothetical protein